ncbi:hypothetical protein DFS34DRAFT_165655 [Phlyctochytrium arcticum]|nr:hypothetical protein DFS34DRAFT_165655 [Phlyctochytrium arcticum]
MTDKIDIFVPCKDLTREELLTPEHGQVILKLREQFGVTIQLDKDQNIRIRGPPQGANNCKPHVEEAVKKWAMALAASKKPTTTTIINARPSARQAQDAAAPRQPSPAQKPDVVKPESTPQPSAKYTPSSTAGARQVPLQKELLERFSDALLEQIELIRKKNLANIEFDPTNEVVNISPISGGPKDGVEHVFKQFDAWHFLRKRDVTVALRKKTSANSSTESLDGASAKPGGESCASQAQAFSGPFQPRASAPANVPSAVDAPNPQTQTPAARPTSVVINLKPPPSPVLTPLSLSAAATTADQTPSAVITDRMFHIPQAIIKHLKRAAPEHIATLHHMQKVYFGHLSNVHVKFNEDTGIVHIESLRSQDADRIYFAYNQFYDKVIVPIAKRAGLNPPAAEKLDDKPATDAAKPSLNGSKATPSANGATSSKGKEKIFEVKEQEKVIEEIVEITVPTEKSRFDDVDLDLRLLSANEQEQDGDTGEDEDGPLRALEKDPHVRVLRLPPSIDPSSLQTLQSVVVRMGHNARVQIQFLDPQRMLFTAESRASLEKAVKMVDQHIADVWVSPVGTGVPSYFMNNQQPNAHMGNTGPKPINPYMGGFQPGFAGGPGAGQPNPMNGAAALANWAQMARTFGMFGAAGGGGNPAGFLMGANMQ